MKKLFAKNFFAPLVLIFLIFAFFLPKILEGKIPVPGDSIIGLYHPWRDQELGGYNKEKFPVKNPLTTDPVLQTYPWRNLVVTSFKNLNLPLWNPYSFSGQPLLANIQSATFQISNLFFLIPSFKFGWSLQIIMPLILSGLFMYFFLKNTGINKVGSAFGALVLPFSGFFVSWLEWGTIVTTGMWLPLILLSIDRLFKKIKPLWFVVLIFSVSQTLVSGHAQTAIYALCASVIYLLFRLNQSKNGKPVIFIILALTAAALVSMAQLLPFLELVFNSARNTDQVYYTGREDWFIPLNHLVQAIAPDFFGNPTTNNYWGVWNYAEFVTFAGIVPLTLALFALTTKLKKTAFYVLLILLSIILGVSNPISKIPYELNIPFISSMQPSRIIYLYVFSLSALSAIGLDLFIRNKNALKIFFPILFLFTTIFVLFLSAKFQIIFFDTSQIPNAQSISIRNLAVPAATIVTFALIAAAKQFTKKKSIIIFAVFLLTTIELFRFSYKFTPFTKSNFVFPQTAVINFLQSQEKPFRIMSTDRRIMPPNASAVYSIESIEGYDPIYLNDYAKFITVLERNTAGSEVSSFNRIITPQKYDSKLTALLNVKYLLSFDEIESNDYKKVFEEGKTKVYEKQNTLPRTFFTEEVVKVPNDIEEYEKLLDDNFDLSRLATSKETSLETSGLEANAEIVSYSDQGIKIETFTNQKAPLIISNVYYPGWNVYIDGKKSGLFKANGIFQLVIVEEGSHAVELKFQQQSFYNGAYLSVLGLVLAFFGTFYLWRKKYQ